MWTHRGQNRPPMADRTTAGQESVWDYLRPPAPLPDHRQIVVRAGERTIANTSAAIRVLETASPPTFYLPPEDVDLTLLVPAPGSSVCEWKGKARYWSLASSPEHETVAWSYSEPTAAFESIRDYIGFYPGRVECFVDGERVRPQPGQFYGGWITNEVVGPFKGEPGTGHW